MTHTKNGDSPVESTIARRLIAKVLMLLLLAGTTAAMGAESGDSTADAVTTANPEIPVDSLELRVKPLTRKELDVEARGWLALLKSKVTEISEAEIAVKEKSDALEKAEKAQPGEGDNAALTTKAKTDLLEQITDLRAQRTALTDRMNLVLDALEAKGGEVEEYRQYIDAVTGIKVDVSDYEAMWVSITGWLMSDEGGLRWIGNVALFVVTVIVFLLIANIAGKATAKALAMTNRTSVLLADFLVKGVRRLILIVGIIVGLAALEVNIGPLLAVIGAAGFVVAFALQDSLGNFASGILILLYRPFDVGDVIDVAGVLGKVNSMNLLSVEIMTPDNKSVIVPNNSVWGGVITNATGSDKRRVDMVFGIGYDDNIQDALRILDQIVRSHELVLKDPEPVVKLHELADSSVNFIVRPWATPADYWTVYWDVTRAVKEAFDREGISIPYPQRDVHVYNALPQGEPQKA